MGKYDPLRDYLKRQESELVTLSFSKIEEILGGELPDSARKYKWFWNGDRNVKNRSQNKAWHEAGYIPTSIALENEYVTFRMEESEEIVSGSDFEGVALAAFRKHGIKLRREYKRGKIQGQPDLFSDDFKLIVEIRRVNRKTSRRRLQEILLGASTHITEAFPDSRILIAIEKQKWPFDLRELAERLLNQNRRLHLPPQIEIWEIDTESETVAKIWPTEDSDAAEFQSDMEFAPIPASDRIVSINHNSSEFEAAMDGLEQIITDVRDIGSNEFDQRDALVEGLEICKSMLGATLVFADQVYNYILEFLRRVRRLAWEIAATSIAIAAAIGAVATLLSVVGVL